MSWLSDVVSDLYGGQMKSISSSFKQWGLSDNDVARFFEDEANKANLRGAEVEGFLSGLPVAGDIIRGVEGVNQMEDLYRNTGKVPNYPGAQNLGTGSLAHVPGDMSRKIEGGSHDLAEFYSGDRDINSVFDRINGSIPRALTSKSGETGWIKVI